LAPSRGGQTTKIHAVTDVVGRPFALTLTPGNVSDVSIAPELLERAEGGRSLAHFGFRERLPCVSDGPKRP
jgi:hypothetical protein